MKARYLLLVASIVGMLSGCSTPKNITYFQDLYPGESELQITPSAIKVQPKDRLSIVVNCQDQRLNNLLNLPMATVRVGQENITTNGGDVAGYTIDGNGDIDFPVIGKLHIAGKTREEIASYIKKELEVNEMVKDPVVTVEFLNLGVSVFGEVNKPGRYGIVKDEMTILDALSMAGDLTIYGKREKVLVLRNEDGMQRVYGVNLCSGEHIYTSPVYYVKQNDVIYVEPNGTKSRQSTVNGNNVRSTSFWISLASLLTSIAILITN